MIRGMERPILLYEGLQINSLLLRRIEYVLLILQLLLKATENLKVARFLGWQIPFMQTFEFADFNLLISQICPCTLQLA